MLRLGRTNFDDGGTKLLFKQYAPIYKGKVWTLKLYRTLGKSIRPYFTYVAFMCDLFAATPILWCVSTVLAVSAARENWILIIDTLAILCHLFRITRKIIHFVPTQLNKYIYITIVGMIFAVTPLSEWIFTAWNEIRDRKLINGSQELSIFFLRNTYLD